MDNCVYFTIRENVVGNIEKVVEEQTTKMCKKAALSGVQSNRQAF